MAFWKKFYKSKYTGAEIDAAVAKAGTVPAVTGADAGKALVVDEEGKIVAGEAGGGGAVIINFNDCEISNTDEDKVIVEGFINFETNAERDIYYDNILNAAGSKLVILNLTVTQSNSDNYPVNSVIRGQIIGSNITPSLSLIFCHILLYPEPLIALITKGDQYLTIRFAGDISPK